MAVTQVGTIAIDRLVVGMIDTNCYILTSASGCVVIDPGGDFPVILEQLAGRTPDAIVLTHRHPDHLDALAALKKATGAPVYAHELDVEGIEHPETDHGPGSVFGAPEGTKVDVHLHDGDAVVAGDIALSVLFTPGHTPGGISLLLSDPAGEPAVLFSGDTLFAGGIGRTDLEGGSYQQIVDSIRTKLAPLPDQVRVLPGHGPGSTVAAERRANPLMSGVRR